MKKFENEIDKTVDINELVKEYGIEIPIELPDVHIGITIEDGIFRIRAEYDEDQLMDIITTLNDLPKSKIEFLGLQTLMAVKKVEMKYKAELEALKSKVL